MFGLYGRVKDYYKSISVIYWAPSAIPAPSKLCISILLYFKRAACEAVAIDELGLLIMLIGT